MGITSYITDMRYYAEMWTQYNLVSVWWMYGLLDEVVLHIFQKAIYYLMTGVNQTIYKTFPITGIIFST